LKITSTPSHPLCLSSLPVLDRTLTTPDVPVFSLRKLRLRQRAPSFASQVRTDPPLAELPLSHLLCRRPCVEQATRVRPHAAWGDPACLSLLGSLPGARERRGCSSLPACSSKRNSVEWSQDDEWIRLADRRSPEAPTHLPIRLSSTLRARSSCERCAASFARGLGGLGAKRGRVHKLRQG
jgi:hypothetical protein